MQASEIWTRQLLLPLAYEISYSVGGYPHWHPCTMACKALLTSLQFAGRRAFFWAKLRDGDTQHDPRFIPTAAGEIKVWGSTRCRRTKSGRYNSWQTFERERRETTTSGISRVLPSQLPTRLSLVHLRPVPVLDIDAVCLYCIAPSFGPWTVLLRKFLTGSTTAISIARGCWRIRSTLSPVLGPQIYPALLCYNHHDRRASPSANTRVPCTGTSHCIRYDWPLLVRRGIVWRASGSLDHG